MCIYGGSYGGYASTQGPMMRPDLFKCAVSEAGLYDINAQYKSGDIRWARGGKKFLQATFGDGDEAITQSPVKLCKQAKNSIYDYSWRKRHKNSLQGSGNFHEGTG